MFLLNLLQPWNEVGQLHMHTPASRQEVESEFPEFPQSPYILHFEAASHAEDGLHRLSQVAGQKYK